MSRILKQFNWRFLLVRFLVNAIAVAITAAVTPKIYFVDRTVLSWLLITVMLGVLNALLKPILQFLTLQFIFVTYGLVIVLVNTGILLLLSFLFPTRFAVDNLLWALVGGLVLGILSSFLESLLGLTMPIVPEEAALRRRFAEQARNLDWREVSGRGQVPEEQAALAVKHREAEASGLEAVATEVQAVGAAATKAPDAEATIQEPAPPEPVPPVADEEPVPADDGGSTDAEPGPERWEGQEEDRP
jgi:putative membrane protein